MRLPVLLLVGAALLLSTPESVAAKGKKKRRGQGIVLAKGWDEAFAEAEKRNIPVLVGIGQDKKPNVFEIWFKNPGVVRLLNDRVVVLIAYSGTVHKPIKQVDPKTKEEREVCPLFPATTCELHNQLYTDKAGFFDYETLPAAFLVSPKKKTIKKGVESANPKTLPTFLAEAQQTLGEGVFLSDVGRLDKKLAKADAKLEEGKLSTARRYYEKQLKKKMKAFVKKLAQQRLERLDAKARAMIEAAEKEKPGPRAEILKRIAREMRGRAPSKEAEAALSKKP